MPTKDRHMQKGCGRKLIGYRRFEGYIQFGMKGVSRRGEDIGVEREEGTGRMGV